MVPIFNEEAENCRVEVEDLGRAFEIIFMERNDVQPKGAKPQLCKEVIDGPGTSVEVPLSSELPRGRCSSPGLGAEQQLLMEESLLVFLLNQE